MLNEAFVTGLAVAVVIILQWGFRHLPQEKWQILATLPVRCDPDGHWHGVNLTYYGLLTANAIVASVMLSFLLFGALGIPRGTMIGVVVVILSVCIPASRLVAVLVERKAAVLTVAGASFVGILLAPWVIVLINRLFAGYLGGRVPVVPALSAMGIAYAFGEGLGRLACISFGCCYGKPLAQSHPAIRRIFSHWHFIFHGHLKKIAYSSGLAGERVVPIQALTSLIYLGVGLVAILLFLKGAYSPALMLTLAATQLWRAFSETLRADYRGGGRISVYQVLALLSVCYGAVLLALLPAEHMPVASLEAGFLTLWHPGLVLFLIGLWFITFFYYGRSMVTGSRLSLYVCHEQI